MRISFLLVSSILREMCVSQLHRELFPARISYRGTYKLNKLIPVR